MILALYSNLNDAPDRLLLSLQQRLGDAGYFSQIDIEPEVEDSVEGAVPIRVEEQVVGAIAVSGVTKEADGRIAQAGADAVPRILEE